MICICSFFNAGRARTANEYLGIIVISSKDGIYNKAIWVPDIPIFTSTQAACTCTNGVNPDTESTVHDPRSTIHDPRPRSCIN
jgi:hypothetical protein